MTQLFDPAQRPHRLRRLRDDALFLHRIAGDELLENLQTINRPFNKCALVSDFDGIIDQFPKFTRIKPADILNFPGQDFDLIIHFMGLHGTNDPVGQLIQCHQALKPDGLFLAACFGGDTLADVKAAFVQAELDITGGISPRFHPMADVRDWGGLLQRAGFALPVADKLTQQVSYATLWDLFHDLRGMGEANALYQRQNTPITRRWMQQAGAALRPGHAERFDVPFDLIFLSGWVPHDSQQKPLRPGSAKISLIDALGTDT